ncbi:MAG: DUF6290 family protein [bacterium]|nr:DUF6290 family protein [bacterium]
MAVISVRFNPYEEKVLKKLETYYDEDRSKLLKKSMIEMYENLVDRKEIETFEIKEKNKKAHFYSAEEILKNI